MVRNTYTTAAQNSTLCVSRDGGYLTSRTDQFSVVRNSHTTAAQHGKLCVSRDGGYLISRTDQLSVMRNTPTQRRTASFVRAETKATFSREPTRYRWCGTLHTTAQNSNLCVSRDEGYLISRTDQLSMVRSTYTTAAENSKLCVSRDEGYLISRTDQLSVVRNSHTTAQNSNLCVSRDEGYPNSRTDQLSMVRNSHTTAQISRSRGPEYAISARVEKASIAWKPQTRKIVHPCSTADTPEKRKARNWSACTDQSRQRAREGKDKLLIVCLDMMRI